MDAYNKLKTTIVNLTIIHIIIGFGFVAYILYNEAIGAEISTLMKILMSIAGIISLPLFCLFGGVCAMDAEESNKPVNEHSDTKAKAISYRDCKEYEKTHCLIIGSRNFKNYEKMKEILDMYLSSQPNVVIVSGDGSGVDMLAEKYAKERNYRFVCFPATQNIQSNSTNDMRDEEMHRYISQAVSRGVIVFWDGSSEEATKSMSLAQKYNNPIRVIRYS